MGKLTEVSGVLYSIVLQYHPEVLFKHLDLNSQDPLQIYVI